MLERFVDQAPTLTEEGQAPQESGALVPDAGQKDQKSGWGGKDQIVSVEGSVCFVVYLMVGQQKIQRRSWGIQSSPFSVGHEFILRRGTDWFAGDWIRGAREQQKHLIYDISYLGWQVEKAERAGFVPVARGQHHVLPGTGIRHSRWNLSASVQYFTPDGFQQTARYRPDVFRILAANSIFVFHKLQLLNLS